MRRKCKFFISDIYSGWFDIFFEIKETKIDISASNIWGKDAPKEWLQLLIDWMLEKTEAAYVLFDGEPGISIVSLEKETLTIAYAKCDFLKEKKTKISSYGNMTFNEISQFITMEEISLQEKVDVKVLIQSVYKAFLKYTKTHLLYDKYEENWGIFPQKEWELFEQCIKQKEWN